MPRRTFILQKTGLSILRNLLLIACLIMTGNMELYAQQTKAITGTVTDASKEALIGVSVRIPGTTTGTLTDMDGAFSIMAKAGDILEFSYVGMKSQTVTVGTQTSLQIILQEDVQMLGEAVVIGYGTAKKQDLTGSIGSIASEEIMRQPSLNAAQAIQGKMSGVNIIASEAPGANPTVVIRGLGTALGGRNPLYIVDGFAVDNIQNISPSDIVSMNVLKDASSASIYGVRAANGVVLITTKKGKEGSSKITLDLYAGIKTTLNKVKMANASQYIQFYNENQKTLESQGTSGTYYLQSADKQPWNTDWYDELLKTGFYNNNAVSVSGGGKTIDYFFSYNYYNEKGILDDQSYQRTTIRNNNVYKFFDDRLKFTQNLNISFTKDNPSPFGAFNEAYRQSPLTGANYSTGRYGLPYVDKTTGLMWNGTSIAGDKYGLLNSIGNPLFSVDNSAQRTTTVTVQGGIEGEFKITDFLKANSRFGATKYYSKDRVFSDLKRAYLNQTDPNRTEAYFNSQKLANPSSTAWANNSLLLTDVETYRWIWEGFVTFNKDFGLHNVEVVAGLSAERSGIGNTSILKGYDVPEKNQYWNLGMASDAYAKEINQYNYTARSLSSYFARMQYNYNHRYYVSATVRRDGSSTFKSSGDYWGTFPSFGVGWTLSEEDFMKDASFLDYLKLRGTWGKLGNQDVPIVVTQMLANPQSSNYNYSFGEAPGYYMGAAIGAPAKNLTWEVTREWGAGFDFATLGQRLSGSVEYYDKMNTNTILYVNPLLTSPYPDKFYDHGAKVSNRGLEASLTWNDVLPSGLKYEIGVNYSYNKNQVKSVTAAYDGDTGGSLSDGQITKRLAEGQPIYSWWLLEADGIWQNQAEINANPHIGSPLPGHIRYKDQNEDGVIDDRDKVYAGSYLPSSTYGIRLSAEYMNFDFSIDGYGVGGNKVYNGLKHGRIDGGENITEETFKNRWTGEGSTNKNPGANRDSYSSTYFLESGAYFRINNITLGYTLKNTLFKDSKLRLYVTAQNPFMFTNYSGFSPEVVGDGNPNGTSGLELSAYPTTRNFLFGVNVQF